MVTLPPNGGSGVSRPGQRPPEPYPDPMLRYFTATHLPEGPLRDTSLRFQRMARELTETLPRTPERTVALRKLLESKDAAVRAALDHHS